jgi:hypothetical protein
MTNSELAARMLLFVRSSQERALRSRFSSVPRSNIAIGAAVGSGGATPELMLEQAIAELTDKERDTLAAICSQLIDSLKR